MGWSRPSVSQRAVRRSAASLLRELGVAPGFDVRELARALAEHRGRPIELIARPFPHPTVFGLWIATTTTDLVFVERDTTETHQRHIALHELGHIHFGHTSDDLDDDVWRELAGTLPPDTVRSALRRSAYDTRAEKEAEIFASVIAEWLAAMNALDRRTGSTVERAFDDPQGWL